MSPKQLPQRFIQSLIMFSSFTAVTLAQQTTAEPAQEKTPNFVQLIDDGQKLQTAVRSYQNASGITVDLIGAIHTADASYYDKLNQDFQNYEAVLFERIGNDAEVANANENLPEAASMKKAFTMFEQLFKLEGQKDGIDYTAKNFVHADYDTKTLIKEFQEEQQRNKAEGKDLKAQTENIKERLRKEGQPVPGFEPKDAKLFATILAEKQKDKDKDVSQPLKKLFAKQITAIEVFNVALQQEIDSVMFTKRNQHAFNVLKKTLKEGKTNIAIFYGAAHLADLEERLKKAGFTHTKTSWNTAWNMPKE